MGDGIIDENDWGYWIKFNYGRHTYNYKWRSPFDVTKFKRTPDDLLNTYAEGVKEKYYLNSIETKSHVALFVKDTRSDALGVYTPGSNNTSLRLAEIVLLTKEAYNVLTNPGGSYQLPQATGVINVVYKKSDFLTQSRGEFVNQQALRKIAFEHDYSLCPNTLNSSNSGKLTLKQFSVKGKNNSHVFPDYKFEYGNNPGYHIDRWDGWGMYNGSGTASGSSHQTSSNPSDGNAWSLTKVTSPEGSQILVNYERDDYSRINGDRLYSTSIATNGSSYYYYYGGTYSLTEVRVNHGGILAVGDVVQLDGTMYYNCPSSNPVPSFVEYSGEYTIISVNSDRIYVSSPYVTLLGCPTSSGTQSTLNNIGVIRKVNKGKPGGNIRVASIQVADPNGQSYKTRYLYTEEDGTSSGVVAQEPDYIYSFSTSMPFYYPYTPVMYGRVSVLAGKLTTDNDYSSKQVYEFETPNKNLITVNTDHKVMDKQLLVDVTWPWRDYGSLIKYEITTQTQKIGKLKSVKTYGNNGSLYSEMNLNYTDSPLNGGTVNHQGQFTEGTIMHEFVRNGFSGYHKLQRTTFLDKPYVLNSVVVTTDGLITVTENKSWDFYTSAVLETQSTSPLGIKVKTVNEPLYTISNYTEFGSKVLNPDNRNMMTQIGATYSYRLNSSGTETGLVGATATVWNKEWENYRRYNAGAYTNNHELDLDGNGSVSPEEAKRKVWRKTSVYTWKGDFSRKQADGSHTFSPADKFNFTSPGVLWQKLGAIERFNHNSLILESTDINNIYSSTKIGYNDRLILSSATNAKFEEMTFSGAEDLNTSTNFFGGEVALGPGGTRVTSPVHTGKYAVQSNTSGAFVFKTTGLSTNKKYKARVWTTATTGRIYYKLNGGSMVNSAAPTSAKKIGNWYYLELEISVGSTFTSLEVGVRTTSGTAYFDDFRFQPSESSMIAYVYDPDTKRVEFVLGDDNMYTRYEYNDRGQLIRTYLETMKYNGEKLIAENATDYRRFHIDQ